MNIVEIIEKKANKIELSDQELAYLLNAYQKGEMKDYQMSSFLMAIKINGLSERELFTYTQLLIDSGQKIEFNDLDKRVDKHSTGGVGDKISLILSPLLAANDIHIGKISGRGLGFTGGTIDKLESIPNFDLNLELNDFIKISEKDGISIINTSELFAPLDKSLYSLRDVTGTVQSNDLIAASIMSKKLLVNSKYIILDLKCGSGAFFKTLEQAKEVSKVFKKIADKFDRKLLIIISSMDQPLGDYIGNKLEVWEAIDILRNKSQSDAYVLAKFMASRIISKLKNVSLVAAEKHTQNVIENGKAFEYFQKWISNQSGDLEKFLKEERFNTKYQYIIKSDKKGYVSFNNTIAFGYGLIELGGGRKTKTDQIDYNVGFFLHKKTNDHIEQYEDLITIYSNHELSNEFLDRYKQAITINEDSIPFKLILEEITW